jgi:hypothetical protein
LTIAGRFFVHITENKECKFKEINHNEKSYYVIIEDEKGVTFKIHCLFGQKMESIKKMNEKLIYFFKQFKV